MVLSLWFAVAFHESEQDMLLSKKAKTMASSNITSNAASSNGTFVRESKDQEIQAKPTNAQLCREFVANSLNALPKLTVSAVIREVP